MSSDTIDPDWMTRHRVTEAETLLGAEHLREQLSSMPFHASRASQWADREGSDLGYWKSLFGSSPNSARIVTGKRQVRVGLPYEVRLARVRERLPRVVAHMADKQVVLPPLHEIIAEYHCRFSRQTPVAVAVSTRRGRADVLADVMLRAIESGEEPDLMPFVCDEPLPYSAQYAGHPDVRPAPAAVSPASLDTMP